MIMKQPDIAALHMHICFPHTIKKDILTIELGKFRLSAAGKSADVSDTKGENYEKM